jgi:diaminopimelate epimerase
LHIKFYKYQGTGNDFIMVDDRISLFPSGDNTQLIEKLCHRRFGIGADGLILLQKHESADFYMKYYNSDGRESSMCGNGGRCIAQFAKDLNVVGDKAVFYAVDGYHEAEYQNNIVSLLMKDVDSIEKRSNDEFVLNTGSPHYVVFTDADIASLDIVSMAKKIRYNDEFAKEGINVNFVNIVSEPELKVRTYERGVEDETYSCGTGVTASVLAYSLRNSISGKPVTVQTLGGLLSVQYTPNEHVFKQVYLQGPALRVFEGKFEL